MAYRVDLTDRAERDLRRLYRAISAASSQQSRSWFEALERAIQNLDAHPARGVATAENSALRQILHGRKPNVYRVVYAVDEERDVVTVIHIRHGRRDAFSG